MELRRTNHRVSIQQPRNPTDISAIANRRPILDKDVVMVICYNSKRTQMWVVSSTHFGGKKGRREGAKGILRQGKAEPIGGGGLCGLYKPTASAAIPGKGSP